MNFDLSKRYCYYFNEISRIPRGSRNEKAISDYICDFAEKHGLKYKQDAIWNVMVDKPASKGYENSEPIILQAHIDMVNEKNDDVDHDFEKDPLQLYVEDGWLTANGTTLGADDGSGVAYMLAILEDDNIPHPPLECIFTVQEEIGLLGAAALTAEDLHGHRYISLDGNGVSVTETSCAGAVSARILQPVSKEDCNLPEYRLRVQGLLGGHSGGKIHLERGNANIIAGRILKEAMLAGAHITLTEMTGGLKENAIPREASFRFVSDTPKESLKKLIQKSADNITQELAYSDPDVNITLNETGTASSCFTQEVSDHLINFIYLMPNGMIHRSMAVEGLTTASLNLGVIYVKHGVATYEIMVRAADDSARAHICNQLHVLAQLLNLEHDIPEGYPGWAYDANSKLRETLKMVAEKRGFTYKEVATHGGLECGVIKGLDPTMDIITLGPITDMIHSPDERMELQSFDDAWNILCDLLRESK